jgi:hypothetical protein
MRGKFNLLGIVSLMVLGWSASAQADVTFRLVSEDSGKCVRLKAADQDNGGLTMADCKNFPDFFVTSPSSSMTPLFFQLNSSRFVCIFATEAPDIHADGHLDEVQTRNCAGLVGSLWTIRGGTGEGFHQIEKMKRDLAGGTEPSNFCLQEDGASSRLVLDVCQGVPPQRWGLQRLSLPTE